MLRISKLSDYAVILLGYMVRSEVLVSSNELAHKSALSKETTSKVLKLLQNASIIDSKKGSNGGYYVKRSPDDITLAEIITAIEGPLMVTACVVDEGCHVGSSCLMHGKWQRVNKVLVESLEGISLKEMLSPLYKETDHG